MRERGRRQQNRCCICLRSHGVGLHDCGVELAGHDLQTGKLNSDILTRSLLEMIYFGLRNHSRLTVHREILFVFIHGWRVLQ